MEAFEIVNPNKLVTIIIEDVNDVLYLNSEAYRVTRENMHGGSIVKLITPTRTRYWELLSDKSVFREVIF